MHTFQLLLPNDGRKLRNLFTALLKKGVISQAVVMNYAKIYQLSEPKIQKSEKKLVVFLGVAEEQEKFLRLVSQISGWTFENGDLFLMPGLS
ncbi:MAG: hypothetical protein HG424_003260 [candidate division SR1 bacterium]|nr:hypothetical protein [candidate division SR1 bacterium]